MPRTTSSSRTTLARLLFLAFVGWAVVALRRAAAPAGVEPAEEPFELDAHEIDHDQVPSRRALARTRRTKSRRLATSLAFATLFFAGAALSAGAGDALVNAIEGDTTTEAAADEAAIPGEEEAQAPEEALAETPADLIPPAEAPAEIPPTEEPPVEEPAPAPEAPIEGAPAPGAGDPAPGEGEAPEAPAPGETPATPAPADAPAAPATPGPAPSPTAPAPDGGRSDAPAPAVPHEEEGPPVLTPHEHTHDGETRAIDPEVEALGGFATIWLHRQLPDPTPPARRLAPEFAKLLRQEAGRSRIGWSTLLAAVRAEGRTSRFPATRSRLRTTALRLGARIKRGEWEAFLALQGRTAYADRAQALARYNRAVGLKALVVGLDASKAELEERVLADSRLDIYGGGRSDILAGRIDVRVLVLMRYLAEAHGQATVSSLHSGHRLYARPGVVSAHIYGLAVDIAALGGQAIIGSNGPGGVTEQAVRNILLLPTELRPQQLISLIGMGGPSFAMANHADHIHAGY